MKKNSLSVGLINLCDIMIRYFRNIN